MKFARWVFTLAGIWGVIVLPPVYLMARRIGREQPPAITHPEFFYGFVGIALAFQLVFLIIGLDAGRYRPLMIPSILEKLGFGVPAVILFVQGRIGRSVLAAGTVDLFLGVLFIVAYATANSYTSSVPLGRPVANTMK
jgi:hypothetical protein